MHREVHLQAKSSIIHQLNRAGTAANMLQTTPSSMAYLWGSVSPLKCFRVGFVTQVQLSTFKFLIKFLIMQSINALVLLMATLFSISLHIIFLLYCFLLLYYRHYCRCIYLYPWFQIYQFYKCWWVLLFKLAAFLKIK